MRRISNKNNGEEKPARSIGGGKRELGGCSNRGKKREEMRRMEIVGWSTKRRWCERETEKNREDERDKT